MKRLTDQQSRVLKALQRGPVCATDFQLPFVVDGGPPILRVPARVKELRDLGYEIVADGWRDKCREYRLVVDVPAAVDVPASEPTLVQEGLFTSDTRSPYREEAA